jgi:hypothetical protein
VAAAAPTPPRSLTKLPARLNGDPTTPQDCEFNFPDESRKLAENVWPRCSSCGSNGVLHRLGVGAFQINCLCPEFPPIFHSSQRAINHWKLVQKILSRNL